MNRLSLLKLPWPRPTFLAARLGLVVVRPAILIIIANVVGGDEAGQFGKLMVAAGVGMVVSAFDSGKLFYSAITGASKRRQLTEFNSYVARLLFPLLVGLLAAVMLGLSWGATSFSALAMCFYVVSERVLDERQRFLLVAERVDAWGTLQLRRGLLQITSVALAAGALRCAPTETPTWSMLALAVSNIASIHPCKAFRKVSRRTVRMRLADSMLASGTQVVANWPAWASGLLAAILGLTDKLIIAAWGDDRAVGDLVAANALSVCALFVSIFFFTPRRGAIVRCELPLHSLLSRGFLVPLAAGIVVSVGAAVTSVYALPPDSRPTPMSIAALAVLAVVSASGGVVREICFYRSSSGYLAITDALCLVALMASTFIAKQAGLPMWFAICSGAVVHGLRCAAMTFESKVT